MPLTSRDSLQAARWTAAAALRIAAARLKLAWCPRRALAGAPRATRRAVRAGRPEELAAAVSRAARWLPFRATCLEQAIALHRLLARVGLDGRLVIGVRRDRRTLAAHAWVEHQGRALTGSGSADYGPLQRPGFQPTLRGGS